MNAPASPAITPVIGTAMEGGTFGGTINVNGTRKGIIVAPKSAGQIIAPLLPMGVIIGAQSPCDCAANMADLLAAGSPAAQQIEALSINGFSDWVIPSRDVVELNYRHFKPGTYPNYCSWRDGENSNSVPPGWIYTPESPAQNNNLLFQVGGEEAFDEDWYLSSTVLPNGKAAFIQDFYDGYQDYGSLSAELRVRAVRLIQLGS